MTFSKYNTEKSARYQFPPRAHVGVFVSSPFPSPYAHTLSWTTIMRSKLLLALLVCTWFISAHTHPVGTRWKLRSRTIMRSTAATVSSLSINIIHEHTYIVGSRLQLVLCTFFTYVHFYVKFYVLLLLLHKLQYLGTSTIPPTTRSSPTEMFFSFHLNFNLRLSFHLQPVPNCKRPNVEWPISEWLIVERPASISPTVECVWHSSVLLQGKMVASLLHNQRHNQSYQTHHLVTWSTQWPK